MALIPPKKVIIRFSATIHQYLWIFRKKCIFPFIKSQKHFQLIFKEGKKWVLIKQILAKLGKMSAIIMHKMSATPLKLSLHHSDFDFSPKNGKNPLGYTHFCLKNLQILFLGAPNSPPNYQVSYHFVKFKGWLFWGCKKFLINFLANEILACENGQSKGQ